MSELPCLLCSRWASQMFSYLDKIPCLVSIWWQGQKCMLPLSSFNLQLYLPSSLQGCNESILSAQVLLCKAKCCYARVLTPWEIWSLRAVGHWLQTLSSSCNAKIVIPEVMSQVKLHELHKAHSVMALFYIMSLHLYSRSYPAFKHQESASLLDVIPCKWQDFLCPVENTL